MKKKLSETTKRKISLGQRKAWASGKRSHESQIAHAKKQRALALLKARAKAAQLLIESDGQGEI